MKSAVGSIRRAVGATFLSTRQAIARQPLILMYHRVAELTTDPQLLAVTPGNFAKQLDVLRSRYRPLDLVQVVAPGRSRSIARRPVAVTIDDGYADSHFNAQPLLERYEIPATLFVTTGQIGQEREFWWDELERLLLQPGTAPPVIEVAVDGVNHQWRLGHAAEYAAADARLNSGWDVENDHDPTARHAVYRAIYHLLHPLPSRIKWSVLEQIRQQVGLPAVGRPSHRALTADELKQFARSGNVDIGAHSQSHPVLTRLTHAQQQDEIAGSRATLELLLDRPIRAFAYPHGAYDDSTVLAVREAGFHIGCTSNPGVVLPRVDHLRLPRIVVRNWDGDTFAHWLRLWIA